VNYFFSDDELAFNAGLDAYELLLQVGFAETALHREGNTIRLYCPLHKDQIRRSLVIYTDKNSYKCQYIGCDGNKGGNLLQFYSAYTGCEISEAAARIRDHGKGDDDLIERADNMIQAGYLVDALPLLQKAVQLDPSNEISRCRLAALYLELGDRENGYKEYLRAAEHFGVRGELDKTLNIYNILLIISPDDVKVRKQLSYLYSRLKSEDEAVAQLKWVVDRHVRRGELGEAVQICRKMIELCPEYPDSHRILGEIMLKQGNVFDAVEELRTATAHFVREGNLKKAKETIELGLRYTPGNPAMKEIRKKIDKALELKKSAGEEKGEQEAAFEKWLNDLKSSIGIPVEVEPEGPRKPAAPEAEPAVSSQAPTLKMPAVEMPKPEPPPLPAAAGAEKATAAGKPQTHAYARKLFGGGALPRILPDDPRIQLFKANLDNRSPDQIESLYRHLVGMFQEVQEGVADGVLSEFEGRVIREFYAAFCLAMDSRRVPTNA
jgi:tetratricopeptide (TPR) repeat protein